MNKVNEMYRGEKELADVIGQAEIDWVHMENEELYDDPLYHPDCRRFKARRALQHIHGDRR